MALVVLHPWRSAPKAELTLVLLPEEPELRLAVLPEDASTEPGAAVEPEELLGVFTLHRSPDERVPTVAKRVAELLVSYRPAWLEARVLELLNNVHGFGTSRNPRGPAGRAGMDHPLAPLGIWGAFVEQLGREVRRGRFGSWEELEERVNPMLAGSIQDTLPGTLRDDLLGVAEPRVLLREPI